MLSRLKYLFVLMMAACASNTTAEQCGEIQRECIQADKCLEATNTGSTGGSAGPGGASAGDEASCDFRCVSCEDAGDDDDSADDDSADDDSADDDSADDDSADDDSADDDSVADDDDGAASEDCALLVGGGSGRPCRSCSHTTVPLSGGTDYTFEAWIDLGEGGETFPLIWLGPGAGASDSAGLRLWLQRHGATSGGDDWDLGLLGPLQSSGVVAWFPDALQSARWQHLAVTTSDSAITVWVDGERLGDEPLDGFLDLDWSEDPCYTVGGSSTAVADTYVRELRISAGLVYTDDFDPPWVFSLEPDTVLYLHFDEGAGGEAADASPNDAWCVTSDEAWACDWAER